MAEPKMSFPAVLTSGGSATLGVLAGLQLLDSVDGAILVVFAPEIRDSLGLTAGAIAVVTALAGVMVSLAALPLGVLGDRHRRTLIAGVCTLVWAVAAGLLGLVQNLWQIVAVRVVAGIGKANEGPIQSAILTEAYPPAGRGRVFGVHRAAQPFGVVVGPLIATLFAIAVPAGYEPWRWAFLFLTVPALLLGIAALRLPEPVRGRFDDEQLDPAGPPPTLRSAFARLRKIRTFSLVMIALGAFGLCVTTVPTFLVLILGDQLGQDAAARGVIASISSIGGLAGAVLSGVFGDRLFARSPQAALHLAAAAFAALGIGFAMQAYAPNVATYAVIGTLTGATTFGGIVLLSLIVASVTPPELRSTAFALVSLYLAVVGGLGGALVTGLADHFWGTRAAVAVVAPAASITAGLVIARAAGHLRKDMTVARTGNTAHAG